MPSLTQPNLKMAWAKEHLDIALMKIEEFAKSKPYRITTTDNVERNELVQTITYDKVPQPIALIVGDFIINLRSALDYLACQLALLTTAKPSTNICFPVFDEDSTDTADRIRKCTADNPSDAVSIMKDFQPYQDGDNYKYTHLWRLNKLWNIEKHRHSTLHSILVDIWFASGAATLGVERLNDKTVVRFPLSAKDMNLEPGITMDVCFGDESEGFVLISDSLIDIYKFISEKVIPSFARFFPE